MIILTIRTDKPEAEIGLFDDEEKLAYKTWEAHRQLAETIHQEVIKLLQSQGRDWNDVGGVAAYKGPGSFTGLRIGLAVANALSDGLGVAIVGETGDEWVQSAIQKLLSGVNEQPVMPEYGAPVHTTQQKK